MPKTKRFVSQRGRYIFTENIDYSKTDAVSIWGTGQSEVPEEEIKTDIIYRFRCKFILLTADKKEVVS